MAEFTHCGRVRLRPALMLPPATVNAPACAHMRGLVASTLIR
jgi:hypothetical protein